MTDQEFLEAFDAGLLDPAAFPHASHVRAAWLCLRDVPFRDGVARLRRGLKQLTIKAGQPRRYHETMTVAYARLIHQKARQLGPHNWPEFVERAPEFFDKGLGVLTEIYDEATLHSEDARQRFVPPASWHSTLVDRFLEDFASHQAAMDARVGDGRLPALAEPVGAATEPVSAMAVLHVASVEQSIGWYARVFGFDAAPYPTRPPYALALLTRGGAELMVRQSHGTVTPPEGWALCIRLSGGGIAALHAELRERDERVSPLRRMPYRDIEFEVSDPDGYTVLVSEFMDAAEAVDDPDDLAPDPGPS